MIERTDGKRRVFIREKDGIEIGFCRNGHQTTVVPVDEEMLQWLKGVVTEFRPRRERFFRPVKGFEDGGDVMGFSPDGTVTYYFKNGKTSIMTGLYYLRGALADVKRGVWEEVDYRSE